MTASPVARAWLGLRRVGQPLLARAPGPVQRRVRRLLGAVELGSPEQLLEDWSQPLVGDRPCRPGVPQQSAGAPSPAAPRAAVRAASRELTCVVVTAHLDVGGMDEVIRTHVDRLPAHGFRVAVLQAQDRAEALRPMGRTGEHLRSRGVEVVDHRAGDPAAWLAGQAPDVVSVHGGATWAIELAGRLGVPCVETVHGMHFLFDADPEEVRRRDALLTAVVPVSELVREQYLRAVPGADTTRLVTIPNGVDLSARRAVSRQRARAALGLEDEFLVTSLARHCVQKNAYGLIDAFADVARMHPDAHLLVAGRPDSATYLAQCAHRRDSMAGGDRVHLRDHLPEPALLLAASDAFVLDSFFEGWALASMEALVMGVPAVCADVGGAREQLAGPEPPGRLVANPLGDPAAVSWETIRRAQYQPQVNREELIGALDELVRDRDRWRARSGRIAASARTRFDLDVAVRRHAQVLRSAATRRPLLTTVEGRC